MRFTLFLLLTCLFAAFCHALSEFKKFPDCKPCDESNCWLSSDYKPVDVAQIWSESSKGEITYKGKVNDIRVQYTIHGPRILLNNKEEADGVVYMGLKKTSEEYGYNLAYQVPAQQKCTIKGYPMGYNVLEVNTYVKKPSVLED
jgi:hypothetical protein